MMLTTLLLVNAASLLGCGPLSFSDSSKKAAAASPSSTNERMAEEVLMNSSLVDLYKSLTAISDDNAFTVAGFEFAGIRTRLEGAAAAIEAVAAQYKTYGQYLTENAIPAKASLTTNEKQMAIEQADAIFSGSASIDDHAESTLSPLPVGDKSINSDCATKLKPSKLIQSSFNACARLAAREGAVKQGRVDVEKILGWAWNRGECGVALASEMYELANRGRPQTGCDVGGEDETNSASDRSSSKSKK